MFWLSALSCVELSGVGVGDAEGADMAGMTLIELADLVILTAK